MVRIASLPLGSSEAKTFSKHSRKVYNPFLPLGYLLILLQIYFPLALFLSSAKSSHLPLLFSPAATPECWFFSDAWLLSKWRDLQIERKYFHRNKLWCKLYFSVACQWQWEWWKDQVEVLPCWTGSRADTKVCFLAGFGLCTLCCNHTAGPFPCLTLLTLGLVCSLLAVADWQNVRMERITKPGLLVVSFRTTWGVSSSRLKKKKKSIQEDVLGIGWTTYQHYFSPEMHENQSRCLYKCLENFICWNTLSCTKLLVH